MPRTWQTNETQESTSQDWLKLTDGESVLAVLCDTPMLVEKHTLDNGTPMGERFYCGTPEGMGCPVCETPEDFELKDSRTKQEGFYPLYVQDRTKAGRSTPVRAHRIMSGGWAVISAFDSAHEAQAIDGEELVGVALRITREGEGIQTRYSVMPKPNLSVAVAGGAIDVEALALRMIRKAHEKVAYATIEPEDPFDRQAPVPTPIESPRDRYNALCAELQELSGHTDLVAFKKRLEASGLRPRTASELPGIIERLETMVRDRDIPGDDPFDWEAEYTGRAEAEGAGIV